MDYLKTAGSYSPSRKYITTTERLCFTNNNYSTMTQSVDRSDSVPSLKYSAINNISDKSGVRDNASKNGTTTEESLLFLPYFYIHSSDKFNCLIIIGFLLSEFITLIHNEITMAKSIDLETFPSGNRRNRNPFVNYRCILSAKLWATLYQ